MKTVRDSRLESLFDRSIVVTPATIKQTGTRWTSLLGADERELVGAMVSEADAERPFAEWPATILLTLLADLINEEV